MGSGQISFEQHKDGCGSLGLVDKTKRILEILMTHEDTVGLQRDVLDLSSSEASRE